MAFEVGKLYKNTGAGAPFNQWVHKCVYVNSEIAVMEFIGRKSEISTWAHHKFESNGWKEYIEPLKKIEYVYEVEGKLHILATPYNHVDTAGRLKYISTIELTFDIHNGLKVEVIPGIG